jgi:glutathione S-transferase
MSLCVFGAALSPFVRKVRWYLAEQGLDYQLEMVLPFNPPQWYYQLSPLGRIPALRDGDFELADSSVICQYLAEAHAHPQALYGSDARQRARVLWLEKYADYELAPHATFAIFRQRVLQPSVGQPCDEQIVRKALEERLPAHFDYLEKQLGNQAYLLGDAFSLADLALCCQLINMRHAGEILDSQRWPGLAGLFVRCVARPALQDILASEEKLLAKLNKARDTQP